MIVKKANISENSAQTYHPHGKELLMTDQNFLQEIESRRTFAIISHPDAAQPFNA